MPQGNGIQAEKIRPAIPERKHTILLSGHRQFHDIPEVFNASSSVSGAG
jgi:hypothetical protein